MNNKAEKIDKIGKFIVDSLLLLLLWSILILPISSFSLIQYKSSNKNEVLSEQDSRIKSNDNIKDYREYKKPFKSNINNYAETSDYIYIYDNNGNR